MRTLILILTTIVIIQAFGQTTPIRERVFKYTRVNIYPGFSYSRYDTIKNVGENYNLNFFIKHFYVPTIPGNLSRLTNKKSNPTIWDNNNFKETFNNNLANVFGGGQPLQKIKLDNNDSIEFPGLNNYYYIEYNAAGQIAQLINKLDKQNKYRLTYNAKGQIQVFECFYYNHLSTTITLLD